MMITLGKYFLSNRFEWHGWVLHGRSLNSALGHGSFWAQTFLSDAFEVWWDI